jgi:hypothetical protein
MDEHGRHVVKPERGEEQAAEASISPPGGKAPPTSGRYRSEAQKLAGIQTIRKGTADHDVF